ncbi:uncharacterized protein LOC125032473 [Penaeus chinensis]|uniref:uncharacterized protein LOC125032473 n=1 Tax=Penaeus chinensis TaxID=139456 RepID=UPI001FB62BC1|nr:uncharacterized protein LOC125032473 [Penaeus chinensis]
MSADWSKWRSGRSPSGSEDSGDDGHEYSDRRVYGDSDRHGASARYGDSDRHGASARYGDSDRHGASARYGDSDRHGASARYGDADNYRGKSSEYEANSSENSDDYDQEGHQHPRRHGQPAVFNQQKSSRRSVPQESEEESEDQETQWLVNFLAREPNFQAKMLTVIKQGIQLKYLDIMIQQNTHIFQETEDYVKLRPRIKTCVWFLSPRGCSSRSSYRCSDLHICPHYISGSCKNNSCSNGHDLSTYHNKLILQPYCLRYIDSDLLRKILQISLADVDDEKDDEPLIICKHYNKGKCFDKKCKYLHFCIYHLESRLKCMGRTCNLNHSFTDQYCTDILERKGISTNESPKDILTEIFTRFPELEKSNRQTSVRTKSSHQRASPSPSPPQNRRAHRGPAAGNQWTTEASEFEGNLDIVEICHRSVKNKCHNDYCQRLHSDLPFHWQVSADGVNWFNLHKSLVIHLEKEFSDPYIERTTLPEPKGRDVHKKLLKLLGTSKCEADFEDMEISSPGLRTPLQLRHIALERGSSDADKLFLWYFLDENHRWVQYGEVDTTRRDIPEKQHNLKRHRTAVYSKPSKTDVLQE